MSIGNHFQYVQAYTLPYAKSAPYCNTLTGFDFILVGIVVYCIAYFLA